MVPKLSSKLKFFSLCSHGFYLISLLRNRSHASRYPGAFWAAQNRLNAGPNHCCLSPNGSWPYMPPEIMCEFKVPASKDIHITQRDLYVPASDTWSMGVVLFELLCLKVPVIITNDLFTSFLNSFFLNILVLRPNPEANSKIHWRVNLKKYRNFIYIINLPFH